MWGMFRLYAICLLAVSGYRMGHGQERAPLNKQDSMLLMHKFFYADSSSQNRFQYEYITPFFRDSSIVSLLQVQAQLAISAISVDPIELQHPAKRQMEGVATFDSRVELRELNPQIGWQQEIFLNARSVGMIVEKDKIHAITDSVYQLDASITLGQHYGLCAEQPFSSQPVVGVGTAFVVGENQIATASHVIENHPERYVLVFGFELVNAVGAFQSFVPSENIYFPQKIISSDDVTDIAVVQLDRKLIDRPMVRISERRHNPINTLVYMIGNPCGLPTKVALNARIYSEDNGQYFYTTLDAFQGNSGSPVFDFNTHELIGLLVSGEVDFAWNGVCNESKLCRLPYCDGEKVVSVQQLSRLLQ